MSMPILSSDGVEENSFPRRVPHYEHIHLHRVIYVVVQSFRSDDFQENLQNLQLPPKSAIFKK